MREKHETAQTKLKHTTPLTNKNIKVLKQPLIIKKHKNTKNT